MIKKVLLIFLVFQIPLVAISQNYKISKREILMYMPDVALLKIRNSAYNVKFDSKIVKEIDVLKAFGIDTIGIYLEKFVGEILVYDSCECGDIQWVAYIQWISSGNTFQKKITECCNFEPIQINTSTIIRYYVNSKNIIDNERIIPVVVGADLNKHGNPDLIYLTVDHTMHYSIYCELGNSISFITYEEFDMSYEDNLFNMENNNTVINSWRKIIQNQVNEKK